METRGKLVSWKDAPRMYPQMICSWKSRPINLIPNASKTRKDEPPAAFKPAYTRRQGITCYSPFGRDRSSLPVLYS